MPIVNGVQVYDCVHYDKHQELGEDCCLEFQCLNCNNSEQLREFLSENNILTEYVKLYTSNISDVENLPKKLIEE